MNKITIEDVLVNLSRLPALPIVVQEVIGSFDNPQMSVTTLASKISQDQVITAKLLRIANSPFYGLSRQVASVQDAVVILGFDSVRNITIAAGLINGFAHDTDSCFDRKQFWFSSMQVAVYAKIIAKKLGQNPEIAFTAGLLHDIGQIVLAVCIPEVYSQLFKRQSDTGLRLFEREQTVLGFDHAMLGAEVARRWNFPEVILHAIQFHHAPDQELSAPVTDIIHVANYMADQITQDKPEEDILGHFPSGAKMRMGCLPEQIKACIPELRQFASCRTAFLGEDL